MRDSSDRFRSIFQDHYVFVWRALRRYGVPEDMLDDATQEVFVTLYRRDRWATTLSDLRSWLWGVARRVASDHRRSTQRRERLQDALGSVQGAVHDGAEIAVLHRDEIRLLDRILVERLSQEQLDVFWLYEVEGLTAPEVAQLLGINLDTVYSRRRAARQVIHSALGDSNDSEKANGNT